MRPKMAGCLILVLQVGVAACTHTLSEVVEPELPPAIELNNASVQAVVRGEGCFQMTGNHLQYR